MRESTIGSKAEHLHWELILQKDDEEIYLEEICQILNYIIC